MNGIETAGGVCIIGIRNRWKLDRFMNGIETSSLLSLLLPSPVKTRPVYERDWNFYELLQYPKSFVKTRPVYERDWNKTTDVIDPDYRPWKLDRFMNGIETLIEFKNVNGYTCEN